MFLKTLLLILRCSKIHKYNLKDQERRISGPSLKIFWFNIRAGARRKRQARGFMLSFTPFCPQHWKSCHCGALPRGLDNYFIASHRHFRLLRKVFGSFFSLNATRCFFLCFWSFSRSFWFSTFHEHVFVLLSQSFWFFSQCFWSPECNFFAIENLGRNDVEIRTTCQTIKLILKVPIIPRCLNTIMQKHSRIIERRKRTNRVSSITKGVPESSPRYRMRPFDKYRGRLLKSLKFRKMPANILINKTATVWFAF